MWAIIRDLTIEKDIEVTLPMKFEKLNAILNAEHEYIFVDWDTLDVFNITEYTSIIEVNDLLLYCKEENIDIETINILSRCLYLFEDINNAIRGNEFIIIDFDEVTKNWTTADFNNDDCKGRVLFEEEMISLPFPYKDEYEDYINWETLWNEAETGDCWREVRCDNKHYLVKL